jgi:hypothetical protein
MGNKTAYKGKKKWSNRDAREWKEEREKTS